MRLGITKHAKKRIGERIGSITEAKRLFDEAKKYKTEWGYTNYYKNGDIVFVVETDGVHQTLITVFNTNKPFLKKKKPIEHI